VRRRAASLIAAVLATAACTAGSQPRPAATGWRALALPAAGARVLVLAPLGSSLLALGSVPGPEGRAPAAWTTADGRHWHAVPLHPATGYGRQAEFVMAGVAGAHLAVYGQAFGGAHSNPRPTLWTGDANGLTEHEQVFTMFGGEHAISVNDEAARPGRVLLAGAWDGASGRYGAAVWTSPDGATWTRHANAPHLASAPGEQTTAYGAAATATGFLAVGDTVRAGSDGLSTDPLAWTSVDGVGWHRIALPATGPAVAERAACDAGGCLLVGSTATADQHLLCWTLGPAGTASAGTAGPGRGLVVVRGVHLLAGTGYVVSTVNGHARVYALDTGCRRWAPLPLPVRAQQAAVGLVDGALLLATTDAGPSRLWMRERAPVCPTGPTC
jgi:hypothetical protein